MLEKEFGTEYNPLTQFFLETQHLVQTVGKNAEMDGLILSRFF